MPTYRIIRHTFKRQLDSLGRTVILATPIAIAVTCVAVVICLEVGVRTALNHKLSVYGRRTCSIYRNAGAGGKEFRVLDVEDLRTLRDRLSNAAVFSGMAGKSALVQVGGNSVRATVVGTDPEAYLLDSTPSLKAGALLDGADSDALAKVCVLSLDLARTLFPYEDAVGRELRLENAPYRVKGVFQVSDEVSAAADTQFVIQIPLGTALRRLTGETKLNSIGFRVRDQYDIDTVSEQVRAILQNKYRSSARQGADPFFILTPSLLIQSYQDTTRSLRTFGWLVAAVAVVLAGSIVANALLLSFNQRRSEVGLKRAIGARAVDVALELGTEAIIIAAVGALSAWLATYGIIVAVRASMDLSHEPFRGAFSPWRYLELSQSTLMLACIFAITIALVACLPSIWRAIQASPSDILR